MTIELLPPDVGGRRSPVVAGYRPLLRFRDGTFAGLMEIEVDQPIPPGAATILVHRSVAEYVRQRATEGEAVELCEGPTPIGTVRVVRSRMTGEG